MINGKIVEILDDGKSASATHTRPNNTDAYSANDVVGTSPASNLTFENVSNRAGARVTVLNVRLEIDVNAIPSGMTGFRLHLYNAAPTAIADNAAFNLPAADRYPKYQGFIEISAPVDLGETLWAQDDNKNFSCKLAAGSTTLYGQLETIGAFTPTASAVKTVILNIAGV